MMIDLKITFHADELLFGDHKKMGLIPNIMCKQFLRQHLTENAISFTNFKYYLLPTKKYPPL